MATCTRARETTQIDAIFGQKKKIKRKRKGFWQLAGSITVWKAKKYADQLQWSEWVEKRDESVQKNKIFIYIYLSATKEWESFTFNIYSTVKNKVDCVTKVGISIVSVLMDWWHGLIVWIVLLPIVWSIGLKAIQRIRIRIRSW
jgi:hypothetical protein